MEDITTTMIAERAGVTRTSLYHLFESKIDVFDALTERYYGRLREEIIAFFDPNQRQDYHNAWVGVSGVYKSFFERTPAAAILLLGDKGAKQVIFADRNSEERLASDISQLMTRHTNVTEFTDGQPPAPDLFQFILKMMTSLLSAGIRSEGKITERVETVVNRTTIAYMDSSFKGG